MKNITYCFVLIILVGSLFAQENIAILDLSGDGITVPEARTLTNKLRSELIKTGLYTLLEREQMDVILKEQGFQNTGCTSQECAVEMGRMLNVGRMVAGSVGKIGSVYYITLRMIDVAQGNVLRNVEQEINGGLEEVLRDGIPGVVLKLTQEKSPAPQGGAVPTGEPAAMEPAASDFSADATELSLADILNIDVNTIAVKATKIREIPGIVSVITADDIRNSGAQDLIDVLKMVPGFEFAADVQGFVGPAIRGLWASDGKFSFYIDDHEYNELGYGTIPLGNHFPLSMIDRIEVVRGPGSAMYGGTSQYGVVKIITKAQTFKGLGVQATVGQMGSAIKPGQRNVEAQFGKSFGDFNVYANGFFGKAQRSDRDYQDYYFGTAIPLKDVSALKDYYGMLSLKYKDLNVSILYDQFSQEAPQYYGSYLDMVLTPDQFGPLTTSYTTLSFSSKYEWALSKSLTLRPKFNYRRQTPWEYVDSSYGYYYIGDRLFKEHKPSIEVLYQPMSALSVLAGIEAARTEGKIVKDDYPQFDTAATTDYSSLLDTLQEVTYSKFGSYLQATYNHPLVNVTLGGRFDRENRGNNPLKSDSGTMQAFVPRFALTKAWEKYHFKALAAQSFRTPYILNQMNSGVDPEKATVLEIEGGVKLSDRLLLTANFYDITAKDLLVYYTPPGAAEGLYVNSQRKYGTDGAEFEIKYIRERLNITLNYAYYTNALKDTMDQFAVVPEYVIGGATASETKGYNLGLSPHKISFMADWKPAPNINWSVSGNFYSKRFAYTHEYTDTVLVISIDTLTSLPDTEITNPIVKEITRYKPAFLLNTQIRFENVLYKGVDVALAVRNILNSEYGYSPAYYINSGTIPGPSREVSLRLTVRAFN